MPGEPQLISLQVGSVPVHILFLSQRRTESPISI
jgi:hypothetical protein